MAHVLWLDQSVVFIHLSQAGLLTTSQRAQIYPFEPPKLIEQLAITKTFKLLLFSSLE